MTSPVLERQTALIRAMSAEQKVRQSEDLYRMAWELKAAWLRSRFPGRSEEKIQEQVRRIFRDARG